LEASEQSSVKTAGVKWTACGTKYHKNQVVFFSQVTLVFLVVITCLVNLTLQREPQSLWITLLSTSVGCFMPAPSLKEDSTSGENAALPK
jgi:hypothetical protein